MIYEHIKMSREKKYKFRAAIALEKLYHNRGVSQDAFTFNLIDEKPKKLSRPHTFSLKAVVARLLHRSATLL
jgi:hypothetical protein